MQSYTSKEYLMTFFLVSFPLFNYENINMKMFQKISTLERERERITKLKIYFNFSQVNI